MYSEHHIPNNQDEIGDLYRNRTEDKTHPVSEHAYKVAISIAEARKNRLNTQFFTQTETRRVFSSSVSRLLFGSDVIKKKLEPLTEEELKRSESELVGSRLFGTPRPGEHLEFFNDNMQSWFFYQSINNKGEVDSVTLHYEVHPTGILKVSSNPDVANDFIDGQELHNFKTAIQMYHDGVMNKVYSNDSGKKAA